MPKTITVEEIISVVEKSDLDQTIKDILIRDIKNEGVTEFAVEQVIAYCDNTEELIKKRQAEESRPNPA